jgi:hypothetical protein
MCTIREREEGQVLVELLVEGEFWRVAVLDGWADGVVERDETDSPDLGGRAVNGGGGGGRGAGLFDGWRSVHGRREAGGLAGWNGLLVSLGWVSYGVSRCVYTCQLLWVDVGGVGEEKRQRAL